MRRILSFALCVNGNLTFLMWMIPFDAWDYDWGEDGDDILRGGVALILAGDNEDA